MRITIIGVLVMSAPYKALSRKRVNVRFVQMAHHIMQRLSFLYTQAQMKLMVALVHIIQTTRPKQMP